MAVSRGKMLGHFTRGPGGYKCRCCREYNTTQRRKNAERRELAAELASGADGEWLAGTGPLMDSPDCRHGCNGDCVVSGSDRCDFTCHP
jgi:hypothetical protein